MCSDQKKPNGQFELPPDVDRIFEFVSSLPIRKVSGIGNVTEQLLKRVLGIESCSDLYEKRGYLMLLFSEISYGKISAKQDPGYEGPVFISPLYEPASLLKFFSKAFVFWN